MFIRVAFTIWLFTVYWVHASRPGVEIVDEEAGHLALGDEVGGLTVALTDQLRRLAGVAALQLAGAHHDGAVWDSVYVFIQYCI
jgi:hypothetical protein